MPTLPAELCRDDLERMVREAADAILADDDLALMIVQEFAQSLDEEMKELGGNRLVVVQVATQEKTTEQKCIFCTAPVAWDDSPDPQCLPRCGA